MKISGTLSQEEIEKIIAQHVAGERVDVDETKFEVTFHVSDHGDEKYITANVEIDL